MKNASHVEVEYVFKRFPNEVEKLMQWVKLCEEENKKMIISFKYADPEIKYSHDDNYKNIFTEDHLAKLSLVTGLYFDDCHIKDEFLHVFPNL